MPLHLQYGGGGVSSTGFTHQRPHPQANSKQHAPKLENETWVEFLVVPTAPCPGLSRVSVGGGASGPRGELDSLSAAELVPGVVVLDGLLLQRGGLQVGRVDVL